MKTEQLELLMPAPQERKLEQQGDSATLRAEASAPNRCDRCGEVPGKNLGCHRCRWERGQP